MGLCQESEERWPEEPIPDWKLVNCKLLNYGTVSCKENEERWPEEPIPDWKVVNCKLLNYGTVSGE